MTEQVEKTVIGYTSSDGSSHRFARLRKAVKIFTQIAGLTEQQAEMLINEVYDHKGELWVDWKIPPSDAQRRAIESAWALCEESVVHHQSFDTF